MTREADAEARFDLETPIAEAGRVRLAKDVTA